MKKGIGRSLTGAIVSLLLMASMFLGFQTTVYADSGYEGDFGWEDIDETTVAVTGYTGPDGLVAIPDELNGKTVSVIASEAFANKTGITDVSMPDTVTAIEYGAFMGCTGLEIITLSNTLQTITGDAFKNCSALTGITIPDSVNQIAFGVFKDCDALASITLSSTLETIGQSTFEGCAALTNITIPDTVADIGPHAFSGCTALIGISFPDGIQTIPEYMFENCTALTAMTVPDTVEEIGEGAFTGCASLASVALPGELDTIGPSAFQGCSALTGITIPDTVTALQYGTFMGCTSLVNITLPDGLLSIAGDNFKNCSALASITIPDTVTQIDYGTFMGCSSLADITLPASLDTLGQSTFEGCTALTDITIPAGVTSIGPSAFKDCTGLEKITVLSLDAVFDDGIFDGALLSDAIYGFDGSTAQTYADDEDLPFHILYTVAFDPSGGSPVDDMIVPSDTTITRPDDPVYEGFAFVAWYTEPGCLMLWDFTTDTVPDDMTLYAKWITALAAPTSVTAEPASDTSILIRWDPVENAERYAIYRSTEADGAYSLITTTANTSYTNTGRIMGETYYYKIRAYRTVNGIKVFGDSSEAASTSPTLLAPTSFKAVSASYSSIRLTWNAVTGAQRYAIYRSNTSGGAYSCITTAANTSYTNTGRTTGQTYYYKVRAYRDVNGANVYGTYSATVYAKPVLVKVTGLKVAKVSSTSAKISYSAVSGANGYEIYRITSSNSTYVKIATITGKSYTNTGLKKGYTYYYKVRAYRLVNGAKVYGNYSEIKSIHM